MLVAIIIFTYTGHAYDNGTLVLRPPIEQLSSCCSKVIHGCVVPGCHSAFKEFK